MCSCAAGSLVIAEGHNPRAHTQHPLSFACRAEYEWSGGASQAAQTPVGYAADTPLTAAMQQTADDSAQSLAQTLNSGHHRPHAAGFTFGGDRDAAAVSALQHSAGPTAKLPAAGVSSGNDRHVLVSMHLTLYLEYLHSKSGTLAGVTLTHRRITTSCTLKLVGSTLQLLC